MAARGGSGMRSSASERWPPRPTSSSSKTRRRTSTSWSRSAVNDVVVTSARPGRMVELGWEIGGERLGSQPCDGLICATPSGSTAYNLSNGGPVMMWGLDAMAITFVAPHSLDARPIVVPRGYELRVENLTSGGDVSVLVDGRTCQQLQPGESI